MPTVRGARHYRPDVSTRLKKCSEHIGDDCTLCCSVTPCAYCLELEIYGGAITYGYAPESANHWTGTVDGHTFDGYWERNQYTDECEFVVELDSVEVYRKSCYEGQECRDSSDEAAVTIGYDEATLRWIKHEPLELPHIIGDAGCPTWFCGECECSCECVCVTITEPDATVSTGELCNVAYECEGPRWEGQIGYFDLALALGRDSYGNCVLESTIDGEEQDAVAVVGCKDMTATITLYSGTTIEVSCKVCSCSPSPCSFTCCPNQRIEDASFVQYAVGPGEFGCPDVTYRLTGGDPDIFEMAVVSVDDETIQELFADEIGICAAFRSVGTFYMNGLLGLISADVVVGCAGEGGTIRSFIKYTTDPTGTLPLGVWLETGAGFICADCDGFTGDTKTAEMWFDWITDCTVCNSAEYVYDPVEGCSPATTYSVRWYFQMTVTCL